MLGVLIWWAVDARKWFKGPKVNIEHQMLGRDGNVLDGKEAGNDSGDSSAGSMTKEYERKLDDDKAAALA